MYQRSEIPGPCGNENVVFLNVIHVLNCVYYALFYQRGNAAFGRGGAGREDREARCYGVEDSGKEGV